jgi:hypothetical protein
MRSIYNEKIGADRVDRCITSDGSGTKEDAGRRVVREEEHRDHHDRGDDDPENDWMRPAQPHVGQDEDGGDGCQERHLGEPMRHVGPVEDERIDDRGIERAYDHADDGENSRVPAGIAQGKKERGRKSSEHRADKTLVGAVIRSKEEGVRVHERENGGYEEEDGADDAYRACPAQRRGAHMRVAIHCGRVSYP